MSVIHTKRIYPYAVGRVDQPGRGTWIDPENAMDPESGEVARRPAQPGSNYGYQGYMMRLEIPTMANLVAARWVVRARFESEDVDSSSISLYSIYYFDADGSLQFARLDTLAPFGRDWTTVIVDSTFGENRLVNILNDKKWVRSNFSIEARANNIGTISPEPTTIYVDYLALEFDYTLPEFPLQVDLRIE